MSINHSRLVQQTQQKSNWIGQLDMPAIFDGLISLIQQSCVTNPAIPQTLTHFIVRSQKHHTVFLPLRISFQQQRQNQSVFDFDTANIIFAPQFTYLTFAVSDYLVGLFIYRNKITFEQELSFRTPTYLSSSAF